MNDRLYRSRDDRMLAGVAGGLAEYWDADPSLIRLVWALLTIFTGGIALVVYIVMAIVVPEDPALTASIPGVGTATWRPESDWRSQRAASRAAARDARRAARAGRGDAPRTGTLIVGGALVLFGTWFLLDEYVPSFRADLFWPLALVALGVLILALAIRPRQEQIPAAPSGIGVPPVAPTAPVPPVAPTAPEPPVPGPVAPTAAVPPSPAAGHQP